MLAIFCQYLSVTENNKEQFVYVYNEIIDISKYTHSLE